MLTGEFLVHAEHVSYLAAAYAYIAGGNVHVGTYMAPQLQHECLAETHDFGIGFTAGAEIGTAFCTSHGQGCEGVLECLLKTEEFQDGEVDRCVEAYAAFVRANGVVELYAVTDVYLYLAVIVDPGYFECEYAVGLDKPLYDFCFFKFGVLVVDLLDGEKNLVYGL